MLIKGRSNVGSVASKILHSLRSRVEQRFLQLLFLADRQKALQNLEDCCQMSERKGLYRRDELRACFPHLILNYIFLSDVICTCYSPRERFQFWGQYIRSKESILLVYLSSCVDKISQGKHVFFCMLCAAFRTSRPMK